MPKTIKDAESRSSHGCALLRRTSISMCCGDGRISFVGRLTGGLVDLARRRKVKMLGGSACDLPGVDQSQTRASRLRRRNLAQVPLVSLMREQTRGLSGL